MIKAEYRHGGGNFSLTVKGHAGAAQYGEDLICCACSTICITAARCLKLNAEKLEGKPIINLQSGYAEIKCTAKEKNKRDIEMLFSFAAEGFEELKDNFGEYVDFNETRG